MFYKIMIKFPANLKLPLKFVNGSETKRFALAEKMNEDFFLALRDKFDSSLRADTQTVEKTFKSILPKKLALRIEESMDMAMAQYAGFSADDLKTSVESYLVMLKFSEKDKLFVTQMNSIMHEFKHIFDYLTNPKIIARCLKMENRGYNVDPNNRVFYDNGLYNTVSLKNVKKDLDKMLDHFSQTKSFDEQINFLQESRYRLLSEKNAHKNTYAFQKRFDDYLCQKAGKENQRTYIDYAKIVEKFDFENKINYLNEKLKQVLAKAREAHKKSLESK